MTRTLDGLESAFAVLFVLVLSSPPYCFSSNSGKDYVKFSISLQKHSSPGIVHLTNYKRRHISASGTAQKFPHRFKPCRFGDGLRGTGSRNMASFIDSQTNCARR